MVPSERQVSGVEYYNLPTMTPNRVSIGPKLNGRADAGHTQPQGLLRRFGGGVLHDRLRDASGNSCAGRACGQAAKEKFALKIWTFWFLL